MIVGIIMAVITLEQIDQNILALAPEQQDVAEMAFDKLSQPELDAVMAALDVSLEQEAMPQEADPGAVGVAGIIDDENVEDVLQRIHHAVEDSLNVPLFAPFYCTTFSFGTLLIVFNGRNTRNTRRDFIVLRFLPAPLVVPPKAMLLKKFSSSLS